MTKDRFVLFPDGRCHWFYFNPDAQSGEQWVLNVVTFNDILYLDADYPETNEFFEKLEEGATEYLYDSGTPEFDSVQDELKEARFTGLSDKTRDALVEWAYDRLAESVYEEVC